jgi:hypothetical protein
MLSLNVLTLFASENIIHIGLLCFYAIFHTFIITKRRMHHGDVEGVGDICSYFHHQSGWIFMGRFCGGVKWDI